MPSMLKYSISLYLLLLPCILTGQRKPINLNPTDTVQYKQKYGLRVGADLSRLIFTAIDSDYTGFELVGDYRLTHNLYLAAEIGREEKKQTEDLDGTILYTYTTSGNYLKLGADFNTYTNWWDMNNAIIVGGRYAVAHFSQTLHQYNIFETNHFYHPSFLPGAQPGQKFSGRTASWLEGVAGIKAEVFNNVYIGLSVRLGFLVTNKQEHFPNLWIPGFNKVTDGSRFGAGFNYSLSYLIPFYKKSKKKKDIL